MGNTPRKRRRRVERSTQDFLGMVIRMVRAAGRRVGEGDEYELAEFIALQSELDQALADAVAGQRANGKSWAAIATATGTTRQGAQQRWGRRAA